MVLTTKGFEYFVRKSFGFYFIYLFIFSFSLSVLFFTDFIFLCSKSGRPSLKKLKDRKTSISSGIVLNSSSDFPGSFLAFQLVSDR